MSSLRTSLADYVQAHAGDAPHRDAVVFEGDRISWSELRDRVDDCARALLAMGVEKGDRVAMLSTSRPEYWTVFLATTAIGAIWTGLNPRHRLDEYRYRVGDSKPKVLVGQMGFEGRHYGGDLVALAAEHDCVEGLVVFGGQPPEGAVSLESFLAEAATVSALQYEAARSAVEALDPALIVYTSGSTGKPKGAVLSHYGLAFGSLVQTEHFGVSLPKVVVNFPIDHVACVADTCCTTLVRGGTIVFQERFDPAATLAAVEAERATVWGGVPTMLQLALALDDFDAYDLSSVEAILWGGAALPREAVERLQQTGARLMSMYGMTETSAHVTYTEPGASASVLSETVGKPDVRFPCRIVDDAGNACGVGEEGELQFEGDYLMLGYWERPEATRDSFTADGWLRTGDLGHWREDGNIVIVGRRSEMFKSGGYNVYPREVELVLEEHEGVAMAAVIAVPDDLYQEVGHAWVLETPGAEVDVVQLREHCRAKLANYKIPKRIHVAAELPMLPVGKVDKKALAARHAATGG